MKKYKKYDLYKSVGQVGTDEWLLVLIGHSSYVAIGKFGGFGVVRSYGGGPLISLLTDYYEKV